MEPYPRPGYTESLGIRGTLLYVHFQVILVGGRRQRANLAAGLLGPPSAHPVLPSDRPRPRGTLGRRAFPINVNSTVRALRQKPLRLGQGP